MMGELPAFLRGVILLGVLPGCSAVGIHLFSCGFETDLCGMIQTTNDHFDWERHSGGTETMDTGPSSAYKGTFYIYIEATEAPSGYTAEVEKGMLQHSGTVCVTFAYHMYGIGVGELSVRSKPGDTTHWRVSHDQTNHWRLGTAEVELWQGDRVSFRVVRSSDSRGDVALDDIVIRTGGCRTTEPLPFSCSFEEGFCGMLQSNDDHFDWTRFDRPTDNTGPRAAADGTWFIYIETNYPRLNGDVARIETPFIDSTGPICVRFKYHVNGDNAGTLYVEVVHAGTKRTIFSVGGNQGSEWQAAEINVNETHSGDLLRFTGQRGLETRDISVDGILISQDRCNDCQVENGGCDHICTGSGTCSCRQGYTLEGTQKCVDVDECLSNETCQQRCHNTVGSYSCGCQSGYILIDDKHRCKDCVEAYNQILDADQAFESSCESETLLYSTPRDQCLREACRRGVKVVAIRNEVCDIKRCQDSDVQPVGSLSSVGWDIFVLNLTWSESVDEKPGTDQGHSDFPVWQVIVAVIVVVLAVITFAVGIAVYLKRRKMASQATEPDRVYYENDAALPTRSAGDVTKPADEAPYDDIDGPRPATASAVQIQMSPPRSDPEDPNPGGYEDLESYEPHVGGPYDVIM